MKRPRRYLRSRIQWGFAGVWSEGPVAKYPTGGVRNRRSAHPWPGSVLGARHSVGHRLVDDRLRARHADCVGPALAFRQSRVSSPLEECATFSSPIARDPAGREKNDAMVTPHTEPVQPTAGPTLDVGRLLNVVAESVEEIERGRRLPDTVVSALRESGVHRLAVPRARWNRGPGDGGDGRVRATGGS